jgi:hypothetical protein
MFDKTKNINNNYAIVSLILYMYVCTVRVFALVCYIVVFELFPNSYDALVFVCVCV